MTYDIMGRKVLDYETCSYDGSRLQFRGPKPDLSKPYVAFLGSTETFGKFIAEPFPEKVAQQVPAGAVNLGMINGGVDAYLNDPAIINVARAAELRVVQVMGAHNLSNRFFKVHPRRNDRFIAARRSLRRLYPDVDFTEYHFTKAMLQGLQRVSGERFEVVCRELQDIWLARMTLLLKLLGEGTVLLWFADHRPPEEIKGDLNDPVLIDAEMIGLLRERANAFVEVVPPRSILGRRRNEMRYGVLEEQAARHVMGPAAHAEAARKLKATCEQLMQG